MAAILRFICLDRLSARTGKGEMRGESGAKAEEESWRRRQTPGAKAPPSSQPEMPRLRPWPTQKQKTPLGQTFSEFGEDEADAAYEVVGWGFVGGEGKELDGKVARVGTEDETAFVEVDEAEEERGAAADGIEGGLMGAVGGEGVVVTIEHGDGAGGDEGVHGGGLLRVGADGQEALPMGVPGGGAGAVVVEARGGDLDGFDDGGGGDACLVHGGGGRDDGNDLGWVAGMGREGGLCGVEIDRQNLIDGEILRGENAVESFEGEGAFAIEEIGDMGLLEPSLLGEPTASKCAAFDASK